MNKNLETQLSKLAQQISLILAELRVGGKVGTASVSSERSAWARIWEALQPMLVTLIPSLVLFFVGYLLLERSKEEVAERQVATANIKEIRDLIKELLRDDLDPKTADSAALAIASFGQFAVSPLISVIQTGKENSSLAAQKGIFSAALTDPTKTCDILSHLLNNRSRGFTWLTHKYLIELIGEIGCSGDEPRDALDSYGKLLMLDRVTYGTMVNAEGAPSGAIDDLTAKVHEALKRLPKPNKAGEGLWGMVCRQSVETRAQ